MKNIFHICYFWFLILFSFVLAASSLEEKRISIEMMIEEQLSRQLENVLSKKHYSISIDVNLSVSKKKKLILGEVESKIKSPKNPKQETLPGFNVFAQKTESQANEVEKREQYIYEDKYLVNNVFTHLILDTKLKEDKKKLAKDIVTNKIKKKYGYASIIKVSEINFVDNKPNLSWADKAALFVNKNIEFLLLLLVLFLTSIIIAFFLFRTRKKEDAKVDIEPFEKDPELTSKPSLDSSKENKSALQNSIFKKIITHIKKSPLISRSCLKSLPIEHRLAVAESISDQAIHNSFFNLMGLKEEDRLLGGSNQDNLIEKTQEVLNHLEKSQEMQSLILEQRFGYLSLLEPEEISKFILNFTPKESAVVIRYMSELDAPYVIRKMSQKTRVEILKALNKEHFYSQEEEKNIDLKLRQIILDFYKQIMTKDTEQSLMIGSFLEHDPNIEETMKVLQADPDFEFKDEYKLLLVSFEEAILDRDNAKKALQELENEEVAALIKDQADKDSFLNTFPEMRQKLILNYIVSSDMSPEDYEKAKINFMKLYRNIIKEASHE